MAKDKVLVPLFHGPRGSTGHWTLAFINKKTHVCKHYHSFKGWPRTSFATLQKFLNKKEKTFKFSEEETGQQDEWSNDCGVYCVAIAKRLMDGKDDVSGIDAAWERQMIGKDLVSGFWKAYSDLGRSLDDEDDDEDDNGDARDDADYTYRF